MIEDAAEPLPADDGGLALLYDWFKHMTGLSLLAIGGVLGLVQGAGGAGIKKSMLIVVLLFVGISALMSFSGAAQIVGLRVDGGPVPKGLKATRAIAAMSLMIGVGAFIYIFVSTLK